MRAAVVGVFGVFGRRTAPGLIVDPHTGASVKVAGAPSATLLFRAARNFRTLGSAPRTMGDISSKKSQRTLAPRRMRASPTILPRTAAPELPAREEKTPRVAALATFGYHARSADQTVSKSSENDANRTSKTQWRY